MRRNFNGALLALVVAATTMAPALARGNDLVIKDGFGEQITVKNGFFGTKTRVVKDRLGNGFGEKKGLFGSKEQDVNILGNSVKRKKGIFGGSQIQGSTIFGDKVETKKGLFGRKTTTVDVSGMSSIARDLWAKNKGKLLGDNSAGGLGLPGSQSSFNSGSNLGGTTSGDSLLNPSDTSTFGQ